MDHKGYEPGQGSQGGDAYRGQHLQGGAQNLQTAALAAYGMPASSPYAQHLQAFDPGFGLSPAGLGQGFRGQLSPSTLPHAPGFLSPEAYRDQLAQFNAFNQIGSNQTAGHDQIHGREVNPLLGHPGHMNQQNALQQLHMTQQGYNQPIAFVEAELARRLQGGFPISEGGSMRPVTNAPVQMLPSQASAHPQSPHQGLSPPPQDTFGGPQTNHVGTHEQQGPEENGNEEDENGEEESDGTEDDFYYKKEQGGVTELAQVGEDSAELPIELFDLPDLNTVLSIQTWNQYLNDDERLHLLKFLPQLPDAHLQVSAAPLSERVKNHFLFENLEVRVENKLP